MIERKKRTLMIVGNVMLAVAVAYTFRFIGKGDFYSLLFSYLRSFIYTAWWLSVRHRIVQKQATLKTVKRW